MGDCFKPYRNEFSTNQLVEKGTNIKRDFWKIGLQVPPWDHQEIPLEY